MEQADMNLASSLLSSLAEDADKMAREAHELLAPMSVVRENLREKLLARGLIVPIAENPGPPITLAAVDGACVKDSLYVADMIVVVAASAEGMTSLPGQELLHSHWTHMARHVPDNDRVMAAAMASHELALINKITHDLRILDGSTTSHILTLWGALTSRSDAARESVLELITHEVLDSIHALGSPQHRRTPGRVVAMPKADSSQHFMDAYDRTLKVVFSAADRFMAAQVLNPGEMLYPRPAKEHSALPVNVPEHMPQAIKTRASELAEATKSIKESASAGRLVVTYLKPHAADTVLKAEMMLHTDLPGLDTPDPAHPALREAQLVARYLSDETATPHMQEPFAQYAVDLIAKNVSVGTEALKQAMVANLPTEAAPYLPLLVRGYRT